MIKFSIAIAVYFALNVTTWAQSPDSSEQGQGTPEEQIVTMSIPDQGITIPEVGNPSMTAYDDSRNGLFSLPDGSCIQRTVFDHGYTNVTINAQGTLAAMKNDVVEDVAVNCP